ncbi:hypothetical protein [Nonomuraea sp. SYSU D8015]|uniref:hypothetical protein n=1 Tax=Nonomuraea sp. SYSU D8015 TaxID=2593644 RepID=UPI00166027D6|nr:hypothetical protein [Nonomuraea sp. SYSU D8015]
MNSLYRIPAGYCGGVILTALVGRTGADANPLLTVLLIAVGVMVTALAILVIVGVVRLAGARPAQFIRRDEVGRGGRRPGH